MAHFGLGLPGRVNSLEDPGDRESFVLDGLRDGLERITARRVLPRVTHEHGQEVPRETTYLHIRIEGKALPEALAAIAEGDDQLVAQVAVRELRRSRRQDRGAVGRGVRRCWYRRRGGLLKPGIAFGVVLEEDELLAMVDDARLPPEERMVDAPDASGERDGDDLFGEGILVEQACMRRRGQRSAQLVFVCGPGQGATQ